MKIKLFSTGGFIIAAGIVMFIATSAFKPPIQTKPWVVPDNFKNMKNAVPSNADAISAGKALWQQHCSSCHGKTGLGDGSKAAQLKTQPPDFTKADFQSQTDGSLFYKTSEGRDDMPSFKKKIPDTDDIWSLVDYIRTLKK
ncbi:MAG TPA: cytochrome c [Chitinophagaceae bacterium]|nr:cytochrome c [Chitinophagaceae bacterium]